MSTLKLKGSTSGYVELTAPATAGNNTITLPTTAGTVAVKDASNNVEVGTGVTIGSPSSNTFTLSTGGSERLRVDSSGRVGVGTTAGVGKLTVYTSTTYTPGNSYNDGCFLIGNGSATSGNIAISYDNTNGAALSSLIPGIAWKNISYGGNQHIFGIGGNEAARIDSSGRLLVGTSSSIDDDARLQIKATYTDGADRKLVMRFTQFNDDASELLFQRSRDNFGGDSAVISGSTLGRVNFAGYDGAAYTPAASITGQVDGTPGANDMPGRLVFSTTADGASSPTEHLRIRSNGDLLWGNGSLPTASNSGIVFTNKTYPYIEMSSATDTSARYKITFLNGNGMVGRIETSGSSTSYITTSDYRLKENVTAVTDGITRLQQLNPSRFNFIAEPSKTVDGFLAHEVQTVVPEAISGEKDAVDDDGNPVYQGIDQSKLVPLLTAALQEAIERIETLEASNADLLARVSALESA